MTIEVPIKGRLPKLVALLAAVFCANGAIGAQAAILTPFVSKLGGTASTAGLAYGIYSAVLIIWLSPFTKMADRFGTRIIYTVASITLAAGSFLCAAAKTPRQLVLYRCVQAIGGPYILMLGSEIPKFFPPKRTSFAMAMFSVVLGLGAFVFSTAAGYIAAAAGYEMAFIVAGTLATIPIVMLPVGLLQAASQADNSEGKGFLAVVTTRNIVVVCASVLVVLLCYMSILSFSPLQLLELGFPEQQIGLIFGTASIGYALIQLPAGALSDKYGRKRLVVIKGLLVPLVLLLLAYLPYVPGVPVVPVAIALALFTGMGLGIGTPSMYAVVVESAPSRGDVSMAMSILFTFLMAPGLAMPYIGKLADLYGFTHAFTIVSALGFTGALIAALFLKETLEK